VSAQSEGALIEATHRYLEAIHDGDLVGVGVGLERLKELTAWTPPQDGEGR
jgi:hypothetical protein